ncbi:amidohydrolase family protein [Mucilaginibacter phyllosphaerae]|uniref:Amidohydrolase n=1 Tax=Mucilaginibacter phyllosphaerae TaxID=1812349 RepID=A0A4Y8AF93_9SPHI|nr:amidohydrolase family protein [Mucilaginibacter phyllosphaerae]MBB3968943.1 L-fuconolactonase [Mucilaginibacter phyllosphaerae]TEW67434.1 amidohydrolase [Mucilaginibacter phyllosphaerae]GGH23409.1 amidohydrolase [Mucilaginibacter phyllosphaerae]
MLKIDTHQHFWKYHPVKDAWITDDMKVIQRDFLPEHLAPVLAANDITGCVAVQANQSETENEFLLGLAQGHSFIKGVVGWVDFKAGDIEERLQHYSNEKLMKGFRHVLQGEPDEQYMLNKKFMHGISLLDKYNFSYDILIKPNHLPYAKTFAAALPNQRLVVDHLAKPYIKDKITDGWKQDIQALAAYPNVSCKVSGMLTEADWLNWQPEDFVPYLDTVFNAFGANRVMYGSDWPVCNVAGGYKGVLAALEAYVSRLSQNEQELFWAKNGVGFYGL